MSETGTGLDYPRMETQHLALRAVSREDAPVIRELAGNFEVVRNTLLMPHPYELQHAYKWIENNRRQFADGTSVVFGMEEQKSGEFCGAIGLTIDSVHKHAELGYWIGVPYWGRGYATEAARAVVAYGFEELGLNRVYARHFRTNKASGRVLQKIGMRHEGVLRRHSFRFGEFHDVVLYGIVATEWNQAGEMPNKA